MKFAATVLVLALIWIAGLFAFVERANRYAELPVPARADAIVALTGASTERLTRAVQLLQEERGSRLLVSGVDPKATREDIRAVTRAVEPIYECCVDLGFMAADTVGNALETADWASKHSYRSLIIVTGDYHMARSLLELKAALGAVDLIPVAVATDGLSGSAWWRSPNASRIVREYGKYLAVLARESFYSLGNRLQPEAATPKQAVRPDKSLVEPGL